MIHHYANLLVSVGFLLAKGPNETMPKYPKDNTTPTPSSRTASKIPITTPAVSPLDNPPPGKRTGSSSKYLKLWNGMALLAPMVDHL